MMLSLWLWLVGSELFLTTHSLWRGGSELILTMLSLCLWFGGGELFFMMVSLWLVGNTFLVMLDFTYVKKAEDSPILSSLFFGPAQNCPGITKVYMEKQI